ncbi:MAG: isoleucine--tRNA ligase [Acidobacteria bacterium]|nr:isoleucine--tRNA ligase [Acidobacteriota bacterium]
MKFADLPTPFDFPAEEKRILEFWEVEGIHRKSTELRRGRAPFVFYEGPPTANGLPHPGHCFTRAVKDLFPRYKTMRGHLCERRGGWDTHGLPVEVEVSKELGIHSKEEIEKYGIEPFIHRCIESVFRYTKEWEQLTRRLGFWVDLDAAYVTYHRSYVESVWWSLKTLFDAGLLYQGHKIVWWWAQGGTALSAGEVGQGYREVDDPSVFVRFPLEGVERTSLLVWTTTPWTLPSNQFAAVHPEIDYALVQDAESGERLYVAAALADEIAKRAKRKLETIETCKGKALVGRRYLPPFDFYHASLGAKTARLKGGGEAPVGWRVVAADFVTTDSGTGLVHEAPAFGEVDFDLLQSERERFESPDAVPLLCAVAPDGRFTDEAPPWAGKWVKDADREITRALRDRGLLFHQEQYRHEYPFCWRADEDPLIQYPRKSWFIRTTKFVPDLLENNRSVNWIPGHIRDGRFGKFLESNVDWALSRERYWGTPLPIWVCESTGHMEAIASYDELLAKPGVAGTGAFDRARVKFPNLSEHLRVHRPYVDEVTYASPKAEGARMRRVPDVIDCWFDSGAMPFAQLGWPHTGRDAFEASLPADFISEALDQTRGWFYSMMAISTMLFGKNGVARAEGTGRVRREWPVPYRNCIVLGLLLGEDGLKMSKSKQNYKTPDHIFDNDGADAMRWLFFWGQAPGTSVRFEEGAIKEGQREFLIRWYNVYSFFVIYANIDGWRPAGALRGDLPAPDARGLAELDRWILSELNRAIRDVTAALDAYDTYTSARRLNDFVDALSNWYLRRSRERFWKSGADADKDAAYATLYHCLVTTALLAAPFVPFISESMYRNLVGSRGDAALPESVHLGDWPDVDEGRVDEPLSAQMGLVREIVSSGRAARTQAKMRVRQPLARVELILADRSREEWIGRHATLIRDELNVKSVDLAADAHQYVDYVVRPNLPKLGPRYGKLVQGIKSALASVKDPAALRRALDEKGEIRLDVQGTEVSLTEDDLQIELRAKEGWAASLGRGAVVVLDLDLTDELRREGLAREVVHHVQGIRKDMALRYEQRIRLGFAGDPALQEAIAAHASYICGEALAAEIGGARSSEPTKDVKVEGLALKIWLEPI